MKKITLVLSALMLCAMMNAQQQVATLIHNGNVRIFYGANAFVDAHRAAVSGDVINLSAGVFNGCDITKNITLRGAGWKGEKSTEIYAIRTSVKISSSDTAFQLNIEGIYLNTSFEVDSILKAPYIAKCRFKYLRFRNIYNGTVADCVCDGADSSNDLRANVVFANCILQTSFLCYGCDVVNCICWNVGNRHDHNRYSNCILISKSSYHSSLYPTSSAYNCVYCGPSTSFFNDCYGLNNVNVGNNFSALFANSSTIVEGNFSDSTSYELTQVAKTQYLGTDGTEVGIYGGMMPFTTEPSFPRITRMNVGKKANSEGKLNVDIEVSSDEE